MSLMSLRKIASLTDVRPRKVTFTIGLSEGSGVVTKKLIRSFCSVSRHIGRPPQQWVSLTILGTALSGIWSYCRPKGPRCVMVVWMPLVSSYARSASGLKMLAALKSLAWMSTSTAEMRMSRSKGSSPLTWFRIGAGDPEALKFAVIVKGYCTSGPYRYTEYARNGLTMMSFWMYGSTTYAPMSSRSPLAGGEGAASYASMRCAPGGGGYLLPTIEIDRRPKVPAVTASHTADSLAMIFEYSVWLTR